MTTEIETDRLILRTLEPGDGQTVFGLLRDDQEAVEQTSRIPWPLTVGGATAWVEVVLAGSENAYALERRADGAMIGVAGFAAVDNVGGAGYWIGRDYRGRGYATEALRALIEVARARGLKALVCEIFPANAASIRVAEKCGFVRVGEVEADLPARGGKRRLLQYVRPLLGVE